MSRKPAYLWAASEDEIQAGIVEALRIAFPRLVVAAVPNGGSRPVREAAALVRGGMLAGMPDLVVALPSGRAVWIETKTAAGRVSPAQKAVHEALRGIGHQVAICRDITEAVSFVRSSLRGPA